MKRLVLLLGLFALAPTLTFYADEGFTIRNTDHSVSVAGDHETLLISNEYYTLIVGEGDCDAEDKWLICIENVSYDRVEHYPHFYEVTLNYSDFCDDCVMFGESCEDNTECMGVCLHETCLPKSPWCGDGYCDGGESCEEDCLVAPVCGNDLVEVGEECDGSAEPGYTCENCTLVELEVPDPVCGNDIVEDGEECDGSAAEGFTCENCMLVEVIPDPVCGNGVVEAGEECDGTATEGFACQNCTLVAVVVEENNTPDVSDDPVDSSEPEIRIFVVGPERRPCVGEMEQMCMVVNDKNFYDEIEGFTYEEGYTYRLEVEVYDVENPPMDASSKRYVLRTLLEKTAEEPTTTTGEETTPPAEVTPETPNTSTTPSEANDSTSPRENVVEAAGNARIALISFGVGIVIFLVSMLIRHLRSRM